MRRLATAAVLSFAALSLAGCKTQQPSSQPTQAQPEAGESLASLQTKLQAANDRYNAACYPSPGTKGGSAQKPFRGDDPACKQAQAAYSTAMQKFNAAKTKAGAF